MRKILLSLLLIGFAFGLDIDYGFLKLKVVQIYPAKENLYEREPIFIRFDVYIEKNETALKKEVLLGYLRIKPLEKNIIKFQQKYEIHPDEKKLKVKNLLYMKAGFTEFPFELKFDTNRMKGLLEEDVLKKLSQTFLLKSQKEYKIKKSPLFFVGDFEINPELIDEGGVATLLIKITGKGFPAVPDYTLSVRNGSAKKISTRLQNKMGYITAVQKFKIVYMDELKVLPIKFRYFDPFHEKIVEKKTKPLEIKPVESEEKIPVEKLPLEKRVEIYINTFKQLYPEYFREEKISQKVLALVEKYWNISLILTVFAGFLSVLYIRKVAVKELDQQIKQLLTLPDDRFETLKSLYRYVYPQHELFKQYLKIFEEIIYKSKIEKENNTITKIITDSKEISPKELKKIIQSLRFEIINKKAENLSKKQKKLIKAWIFIEKYSSFIMSAGFVLLATAIIQLFVKFFPEKAFYLNIINLVFFIAGILIFIVLNRPVIKVKDDRV